MITAMNGNRWPAVLAVIFAALWLATVLVSPTTRTTTITQTAPAPPAVASAVPGPGSELTPANAKELRDVTPDNVPPAVLKQADRTEQEVARDTNIAPTTAPLPLVGAQGYSCRVRYAKRGFGGFRSYVFGAKWHYTVSRNVRGWGDIYSIADYLERIGLSASVIMDFEGHCLQTVPYDRNPYTQGAFNETSISVEIVAYGDETRAQWLAAPLIKNGILAAWTRDMLLRYNLPLVFVDPAGCQDKRGYTDHDHLECSNDHLDVSPRCAFNNAINGHALYPAYVPSGCSGFPFDVVGEQIRTKPGPACGKRCHQVKALRAKHQRTHQRFRKNKCAHGRRGGPIVRGYCGTLRSRNAAVHKAARRWHVSLKGTYR